MTKNKEDQREGGETPISWGGKEGAVTSNNSITYWMLYQS
jgi:hypothetical protein